MKEQEFMEEQAYINGMTDIGPMSEKEFMGTYYDQGITLEQWAEICKEENNAKTL